MHWSGYFLWLVYCISPDRVWCGWVGDCVSTALLLVRAKVLHHPYRGRAALGGAGMHHLPLSSRKLTLVCPMIGLMFRVVYVLVERPVQAERCTREGEQCKLCISQAMPACRCPQEARTSCETKMFEE